MTGIPLCLWILAAGPELRADEVGAGTGFDAEAGVAAASAGPSPGSSSRDALTEVVTSSRHMAELSRWNLVVNARDAMDHGPGLIEIRTGHGRLSRRELEASVLPERLAAGRYAWVDVKDDGRGMDTETQVRIFDPFFSTKPTGRGLGLSVAYAVRHGMDPGTAVKALTGDAAAMFGLTDRVGRLAPGLDAETTIADQTVFHDRARPSHLTLPVIPR